VHGGFFKVMFWIQYKLKNPRHNVDYHRKYRIIYTFLHRHRKKTLLRNISTSKKYI